MGTSQCDESKSQEKVLHQKNKCENTTSSQYGLRMGGLFMNSFDPLNDNSFIFRNKYWGRYLNLSQMDQSIYSFLLDKDIFLSSVCREFLNRMLNLRKIVEDLSICKHRLNLIGSSLIFIYEVDKNNIIHVDLRIIDFSSSSHTFDIIIYLLV